MPWRSGNKSHSPTSTIAQQRAYPTEPFERWMVGDHFDLPMCFGYLRHQLAPDH